MLTGDPGSGKDTLLNTLLGKGFQKEYRATPKDEKYEVSSEIDYTIINLAGHKKFAKRKEEIKNDLQELKNKEQDRKIIYIYMFNVLDFINNDKLIIAQIENAKKESEEREFTSKIIGTRGDKIDKNIKPEIENRLRKEGYDAIVFDMTKVSKDEVFNFLERD
ncbi:hypothetical protein [Campylobacter concisus]|uniref:hypothetical protein n=1 Tax=Campylobacter concisus TaxID=199 RepID=UPI000CD8355B